MRYLSERVRQRMQVSRRTLVKTSLFAIFDYTVRALSGSKAQADNAREILDVTIFGAKGDGVNDDTEAIGRAFAKASSSQKATHVFFPKGRYLFSNFEYSLDDVEVSGDGATLVSSLPVGTPTPAIWLHARKIWIHDLIIDYTASLDIQQPGVVESRKPNAYGLRLGGVRDPQIWNAQSVVVERVHVSNARGGGIQISYATNVTVRNCRIRQVLGNGLGFDDCIDNVLAEDNDIALTGDDLLVIVTDKRVPTGTRHVIFRRNTVASGYAKGIASSGVDGMIIEDNNVDATYAGGIMVFSDTYYGLGQSQNVEVKGNTVINAGRFFGKGQFRNQASSIGDSIYIGVNAVNVSVHNNMLSRSVRDGIVATTVNGLSIIGNTVQDHPGVGIFVGDPKQQDEMRIENFQIKLNNLKENRDGIVVGSARNGEISHNIISLPENGRGRRLLTANTVDVQIVD